MRLFGLFFMHENISPCLTVVLLLSNSVIMSRPIPSFRDGFKHQIYIQIPTVNINKSE